MYRSFDVLWQRDAQRFWSASKKLKKSRTHANIKLKPQSHQILRFVDRTIGCDMVSYDRSAMFPAISFYDRTLWFILCDWLVGHMLICMIIMYFYLLTSIKQVYCKEV